MRMDPHRTCAQGDNVGGGSMGWVESEMEDGVATPFEIMSRSYKVVVMGVV